MIAIARNASEEELSELLRLLAHAPEQANTLIGILRQKYACSPEAGLDTVKKTPDEVIASILEWASKPRPPAPALSNEALRRENLYD